MRADRRRIVVIGGGASGVLLAAHLLNDANAALRVTLVERRPDLGAGIAYATHPAHLLNVRAGGMSAFADAPDHFWRWVVATGGDTASNVADRQSFAPRRLYRDYLTSLLAPHLGASGRPDRLTIVHREALRIGESPAGVDVELDDGASLVGHIGVLATGNEGPPLPAAPWRRDGWTANDQPVAPDARVVIIGAGLTMVDQVMSLLHANHHGPITAISRQGMTPQAHQRAVPLVLDAADLPLGTRLSYLLRKLRDLVAWAEAEGKDWRSVVDGLRPHTSTLWQSLPAEAKLRFLRHARTMWDIHRHRIAPEAYQRLQAAKASGQLRVLAGSTPHFEETPAGILVHYRPRRAVARAAILADIVVECRGRAADIEATTNPVLQSLLADGLARPDVTRLGLDVTPDCALVQACGQTSSRLYAIGPLTAGVFWESTAVPDIRVQVASLSRLLGRF